MELRINFLLEMVIKCFALPHFWECKRVNIWAWPVPNGGDIDETAGSGRLCGLGDPPLFNPSWLLPSLPLDQKMVEIWILYKIVIYCWWEKGSGRKEEINILLFLNFIPGLEQKRKDFRSRDEWVPGITFDLVTHLFWSVMG